MLTHTHIIASIQTEFNSFSEIVRVKRLGFFYVVTVSSFSARQFTVYLALQHRVSLFYCDVKKNFYVLFRFLFCESVFCCSETQNE